MKTILVTGGCGFIGSHTCLTLLQNNYKVIIIDSNHNSSPFVIERILKIGKLEKKDFLENLKFYKGDIRDKNLLKKVFSDVHNGGEYISSVIHFAGLKSVEESVINPLLYWNNNLIGSLTLFSVMEEYQCRSIVFSSSATIYEKNDGQLLNENFDLMPANPYGETKLTIEKVLSNLFQSFKKWNIANLRYFNPIGAHPSGLIGENPLNVPNNLFPYICKVASGEYPVLKIFGNDWPTRDGTCIRDYIHVMDLAEAHYKAILFLENNRNQLINLNIGTGKGSTVMELVNTFMKVNKCNIPFTFESRRNGDITSLVADNKLVKDKLKWLPQRNISEMCRDGWNWQKNNPKGFNCKL